MSSRTSSIFTIFRRQVLINIRRKLRPRVRINVARSRRRARRFYRPFVEPGSLCFDVGANVGDRTWVFLSLGARVVAVEPQPNCVAQLLRLRQPRLVIEELAVGEKPGVVEMSIADVHTISSMSPEWIARVRESGRFDELTWPRTLSVQVTTLDALIDQHGLPSFCKIDVEGYEPLVLAGLSQPIPAISFEFTPEYSEAAVASVRRLQALGMELFNFSWGETLTFVWSRWRSAGDLLELLERAPLDGGCGDVYATASEPPSTDSVRPTR
jgi:FkbM family methyltransferase